MTKSVKPTENELSELYQTRKRAHQAPRSIKQFINDNGSTKSHWHSFFNRISGIAIAAGTLLLVSLVALQQHSLDQPMLVQDYTLIELHSLDTNKQSAGQNVRSLYAKHYNDFLHQKQILAKHHSKAAILNQIEDGWELTTCNKEIVKISNGLINALRKIDKVGGSPQDGEWVAIDFDKNGIIIAIASQPKLPHC